MKKTIIKWGVFGSMLIALIFYVIQSIGMQSLTAPFDFMQQKWYFIAPLIAGFGIQTGLYRAIREKQRMMGMLAASGGVSGTSMALCCMHNFATLLPVLGLSGVSVFFSTYQNYVFGLSLLFVIWGIFHMYKKYRELK